MALCLLCGRRAITMIRVGKSSPPSLIISSDLLHCAKDLHTCWSQLPSKLMYLILASFHAPCLQRAQLPSQGRDLFCLLWFAVQPHSRPSVQTAPNHGLVVLCQCGVAWGTGSAGTSESSQRGENRAAVQRDHGSCAADVGRPGELRGGGWQCGRFLVWSKGKSYCFKDPDEVTELQIQEGSNERPACWSCPGTPG